MSSKENVSAKLWQAIDTLATNEGRLTERLASAATSLTGIYLPPGGDLPRVCQEELESIIHDLTREPAKENEGRILATTRKMSDHEARQVATRILSLYSQTTR